MAKALPLLGVNVTAIDSSAKFPLGTCFIDDRGCEYVYASGSANTVAGDFCIMYGDGTTARMTKAEVDKLYPVGVAQAAIVAAKYGWFLVAGWVRNSALGTCNALVLCAKEVAIYTSATAGSVDDATGGQTKLNRIMTDTTQVGDATTNAGFFLNFPSAG